MIGGILQTDYSLQVIDNTVRLPISELPLELIQLTVRSLRKQFIYNHDLVEPVIENHDEYLRGKLFGTDDGNGNEKVSVDALRSGSHVLNFFILVDNPTCHITSDTITFSGDKHQEVKYLSGMKGIVLRQPSGLLCGAVTEHSERFKHAFVERNDIMDYIEEQDVTLMSNNKFTQPRLMNRDANASFKVVHILAE